MIFHVYAERGKLNVVRKRRNVNKAAEEAAAAMQEKIAAGRPDQKAYCKSVCAIFEKIAAGTPDQKAYSKSVCAIFKTE